ncbi:hypothetical protein [Bowdeniella massiliensis]|uniref:hypothetical protein n=1 Tax=Bowdeniella massiliensis TaxID=2932264 RepID=UPI0020290044|nr:hypothetical protein [Bowdeniella massiliensis]
METIDISTTALMTVPGIAGIASAFLTALLTRWTTLAPRWRPWLALAVAVATTAIGVWITYRPESWEVIAVQIAAVAGVAQVVYTALKPALKLLNGDTTTVPPVDAEVGPIPADYGTAVVTGMPTETAIVEPPTDGIEAIATTEAVDRGD